MFKVYSYILGICALNVDKTVWRIGFRNGDWSELSKQKAEVVVAPRDWLSEKKWSEYPSEILADTPLTIVWEQSEKKPLLFHARFLGISCSSPVTVELLFNGRRVYLHRYEPAVVWLHKHFDVTINCYLPKHLQKIGENSLTILLKENSAKIDFMELKEVSPEDEMWLFGNLRSARNVIGVKIGVYPLDWIDFDCCSVGHHEMEPEKGKRILTERWARLKELYTGIRLKPMSNIWGVPKWNSKYIKTGKASNPDWKPGCGKVIHYHDYWVGGDLVDYDVWEDFVSWHVKRTKDWVKLYRGLGEWDVHWFGNGGSWEGFFEYSLRYGKAIKQNDPDSFVILSGNHTWDYVRWHAELHGLPREAWFYYEKLTENKEVFKWVDALGYHPYEYNNSNPNSPWIAAEHLRTLLDRKGLQHIRVAVDEWGHDLGYKFIREALPRLMHNGVVNVVMVDWCLVEGVHEDKIGLVHADGRIKNRETFECWRAWSELFHGARRYWCGAFSERDTSNLCYAASTQRTSTTVVLDNLGSEDLVVEVTVPLRAEVGECSVLVARPELYHLALVAERKVRVVEGEAVFKVNVPGKNIRVVRVETAG